MKKYLFGSILLILALSAATYIWETPSSWEWQRCNLQVRLSDLNDPGLPGNKFSVGAGWSKENYLCGDRWRTSTGGFVLKDKTIKNKTSFHLVKASSEGAMVEIDYIRDAGKPTSFSKLLFVPKTGNSRTTLDPDAYVTGEFVTSVP